MRWLSLFRSSRFIGGEWQQRPFEVRRTADLDRWLARRRWARAGWLYAFMLVMSIFFLGPFLMGLLSSMKDNPNEYPPRLVIPQLTAAVHRARVQLGPAGRGQRLARRP